MARLLILLALIAVGYLLYRGFARLPKNGPQATGETSPEAMVRCAHCGVHLPQKEALRDAHGYFCSEEHRRLG